MVMSDQPIITALDQDHRETSRGLCYLTTSNCAKGVEPRRISNIVIAYDDLAVVDHNFVPASCQAPEIAADSLGTFRQGMTGGPEKNCVRRIEIDQRIHVVGIESCRPVIDDGSNVFHRSIRATAPQALAAVREIIADPDHRDRLKAAQTILERVEPTMQRLDVRVQHQVIDRDAEAVAYLRKLKALGVSREKMEAELGYSDLPRYEKLLQLEDARNAEPVIDGDYSVIEDQR